MKMKMFIQKEFPASTLMDNVTRLLDTVRHVIHSLVRYLWSGDIWTSGDALRAPYVVKYVRGLTSDLVCGNQVIDGLRDALSNIHNSQRGRELCGQAAKTMYVWFIDGYKSTYTKPSIRNGTRPNPGKCMIHMSPGFIQRSLSLLEICGMKDGHNWYVDDDLYPVVSHAIKVEREVWSRQERWKALHLADKWKLIKVHSVLTEPDNSTS